MGIISKTTKVLLGATALTALSTGTAFAAGTAAGTTVENTFTLDYKVGGTDQPQIITCDTGCSTPGTSTKFTVDRLIDLTVVSNGDTTVAQGAQDQELVFSLTNTGNDTQDYILSLVNATTGDQFDATGLNITYYFDDGTAGFGAGDLAGTAHTYTPGSALNTESLAPDTIIWVVVDGDIPAALTDLDEADITLVADTAVDGTTGAAATLVVADTGGNTLEGAAENVLADIDSDGAGTNDGANDGQYAATGTYIVADADMVATKAVTVISQDGSGCATIPGTPTGGLSIPGACVEYVITATNNGTTAAANATDVDISDVLPPELEFVAATVTTFLPGTLTTPVSGTDCVGGACTVAVTAGALNFGETGTIVIRALLK